MPKVSKRNTLTPGSSDPTDAATQAAEDGSTAKPIKAKIERPPAFVPRPRHAPDASEATIAVLSYLHGPVYALDRKPHLAQHYAVPTDSGGARTNDPARIASAILAAVAEALEHQAVKWKGAPGVSSWAREAVKRDGRRLIFPPTQWVGHVNLPKTFPDRRAQVVWDDDGFGLAGRDLCIEFALVETAAGTVTGFSFRYDLSGTPFVLTISDPLPPAPKQPPATPLAPTAKLESSLTTTAL